MTIDMFIILYFSIGFNLWLAITILSVRRFEYGWKDIVKTVKDNWLRNMLFVVAWVIVLPQLLLKRKQSNL